MAAVLAASLLIPVQAEDAPAKKWKNDTEFSFVSTNGNSKTSTTAGKNTFLYNWSKPVLELIFGGFGSQNRNETTAEKYYGSEKFSYKLTDRNYAFQKFAWDKDRFAGIRNRYDNNAGLGRELVKSKRHLLVGELGGGYIVEERVNEPTNSFTSGRAYSKYEYVVSPTSKFFQDVEYLGNFDDTSDFRVNTETALMATLTTHFMLKVSYKWNHVGKPPAGYVRNDTTTGVALLAQY